MESIKVAVCCEHKLIMEGISRLLEELESIQILVKESTIEGLPDCSVLGQVHILIMNPHEMDIKFLNMIVKINVRFPKLSILILSAADDEDTIHKTIKAGAKGFLSRDNDQSDLLEALYTLRNGHDYFSKSITRLLLRKYISDLKSDTVSPDHNDLDCLSARELEVLTLWGNSYTNAEISRELYISIRTVESHKTHIMQKLKLRTAVDMVKFAIKNSIIDI